MAIPPPPAVIRQLAHRRDYGLAESTGALFGSRLRTGVAGRVAGVLVVVALLVGACARVPGVSPATSPSTAAASTVPWHDCVDGFQCGSLNVPVDYSDPQGREISL